MFWWLPFLNWDLCQQPVEGCACVLPTLYLEYFCFILVLVCVFCFCFKAELAQEFDFLHKRGGQSQERQCTLDSLESSKRKGVFSRQGEWRGIDFYFRCCTIALISLRYLFETPTNFIYIFIRCRQGWHICVRRPPVHRRLHFYIAVFWKLAGEDGWVLNCGVRVFTAIQGTSARTAHRVFHVICKARESS